MKRKMKAGSTSQTVEIIVLDKTKTDGSGLAGLTSGSAGLTWYYHRQGAAASVAVTLAAETLGTWTSGGFVAVDGTNAPGAYELGVPDLALATGAKYVTMFLRGAASMADVRIEIELDAVDYQDAIHFGLSSLPNAAAAAANGLLTNGTGAGQLSPDGSGRTNVGKWLDQVVTVDGNNLPNTNAKDWGGLLVSTGLPYVGPPPTAAAIATAVMTDVSDTIGVDIVAIKAKTDALLFTGAGNLKSDVEQWLNGTIPAPNVTGVPKVDLVDWLGVAPNALQAGRVDSYIGALLAGVAAADVWNASRATYAAAGSFGRVLQIVRDGTAQAGAAGSITLDAGASATDNTYNNCLIEIIGGTGVGQSRFITGYVGATKVATVNSNWKTNPDATSVFSIQFFDAIPGATAPTATQVATAVWQDLTAGSDFTTANSIGALLKLAPGTWPPNFAVLSIDAATGAVIVKGLRLERNTAYNNFTFIMLSSTDHITPKTALTITAQRSIDGGAFAACANAAVEMSNGAYKINLAASDLNGDNIMLRFSATGSDDRFVSVATQTP